MSKYPTEQLEKEFPSVASHPTKHIDGRHYGDAPVNGFSSADPNDALTWPEHSPSVAMDVDLGLLGRRLDFDMPAYNQLLDQQGVGGERSGLHIEYKHGSKLPFGVMGGYINEPSEIEKTMKHYPEDVRTTIGPPSKYIEISTKNAGFTTPEKTNAEANETLLHETMHFVQDTQGNLLSSKEKSKRTRIRGAAIVAGSLALSAVGMRLANFDPALAATMAAVWSPGAYVAGRFAGKKLEYMTNPNEREAREFTDSPPSTILTKIFSS